MNVRLILQHEIAGGANLSARLRAVVSLHRTGASMARLVGGRTRIFLEQK
ncbi:MAG TPA: hypothetical protein VNJ09_02515 [Chthonomonadales bacterium]|nr:hypothetical protein [Chthonomonadales bacterium]